MYYPISDLYSRSQNTFYLYRNSISTPVALTSVAVSLSPLR